MDVETSKFEAAEIDKDNDDVVVAVIIVFVLVVAPSLLLPAKLIKVMAMLN